MAGTVYDAMYMYSKELHLSHTKSSYGCYQTSRKLMELEIWLEKTF